MIDNLLSISIKQQPLLIFGGCYSNLQATIAIRDWAEQHGFLPEQCICTGDIVAYCANPLETAELVRSWGVHCIQGNVEQSLAKQTDDCGCGFEQGTVCDVLSKGWYPYSQSMMNQDILQWFDSLPAQLFFEFGEQKVQIVHGAPSDVSQFMYASESNEKFLTEFELSDADVVVAGHSGLPFTKTLENKVWHNSGAIGMPANDGTDRVWFSVLNQESDKLTFTHHALQYDTESAYQAMVKNDLTQGYHEALKTGL